MFSKIIKKYFSNKPVVKILVVCLENICRSPVVEGVLNQEISRQGLEGLVRVDSAGARVSMLRSRPDVRAVKVVSRHGVDISGGRARQISGSDFIDYDLIFAVDKQVLDMLLTVCPATCQSKVTLLMGFVGGSGDIPDPYFGNEKGFEKIVELIEGVSHDFIRQVKVDFASKINHK
ncbi:low molecular weight protein-tyrosine-phosphatase [Neptunomonas antarctica]|uniref:protein-tyrosine-phosphatase n=1 Tax=Neptunomonas antarctica TaxID=619304 RepID=A0A1N7JEX1_9GAMM|nr:low molecular weight protein-tyrosine-phosphatase [Neptunomonas antarctica]SIS47903.1 protein-tyrosine phosphatase [Neptunomonas antarctica]